MNHCVSHSLRCGIRPCGVALLFCALLVLPGLMGGCSVFGAPAPSEPEQALFSEPLREIPGEDSAIGVYELTQTVTTGTLSLRGWALPEGDRCVMGSWQPTQTTPSGRVVWSTALSSRALTYRHYNGAEWIDEPLREGVYQYDTAFFLSGEDYYMMCYTPQVWELLENGSRRKTNRVGYLRADRVLSGWLLTLCAPETEAGSCADFTCLTSTQPLIPWETDGVPELWSNYRNAGDGRWCYDGYYYPAVPGQIPSGDFVCYWLPAAYLCRSFSHQADSTRAAWDLAICTVDTMLLSQTEEGFLPTVSISQWLLDDYGIGSGFYDTRFNTEFWKIVLRVQNLYPSSRFVNALNQYIDFYLNFAAQTHTQTDSGGWLIPDYAYAASDKPVHTSLNHQIAECQFAYEAAQALQRDELRELADRMLLAVDDTGTDWVRSDGNLHYAIFPDGSYGRDDYPYLTYNDLYALQEYLKEQFGSEDETLTTLMDAKRRWMDANGVTAYQK